MNLIKNVDGTWEMAKQRIRQDLDTIQRELNQIRGIVNKPEEVVEVPPATITPGGRVTTYGGTPLTSVAGSFGLRGAGTPANPLYISIDGTTITVNSSGQLTASAASSGPALLSITGSLTAAQVKTLNATPITVVSGIASTIIIPVTAYFRSTITGAQAVASVPQIKYTGVAGSLVAAGFNWNQTSSEQMLPIINAGGNNTSDNRLVNIGIDITSSSGGGTDGTGTYRYVIVYYTFAQPA